MKFRKPSRAAATLALVMTAFLAATIYAQIELAAANTDDQTTAKLVTKLLTRYHISQGKIDEKISGKMFDQYIRLLDPYKLYFFKSDIDKLRPFRTKIAGLAEQGDVQFAYDTFKNIYRKRVKERVALAHKLIDQKHDFTIDETLVIDEESIKWTDSKSEMHDRWRKRIKADILALKLGKESMTKIKDRLHKRYRSISRTFRQMEDYEIFEMYLSSLTHAFDPHSSYMSPQRVEDFQIIMSQRLQGIGASLRSEDGYTIVANIVEGGAADKDGRLKKNDRIIGVDPGDGTMIDIVEMKLSKVVRYIRGKAGTKVKLKVKKPDVVDKKTKTTKPGKTETYELTRQVIQLKSSLVKGEIIDTKKRIGAGALRVGVINIPTFYRDFERARRGVKGFASTSRDVRKVLKGFRDKGGVDLVVVDLRDDGGGALTEAIEVSGLFIDKGPVVQVRTLAGKPKTHDDIDAGTAYDGPLVVLCNRHSASASEIFAGVIKDYKRGIVVGDKSTHGKGTVQNVMPVGGQFLRLLKAKNRGALKVTIQQFYRVNGDSTQIRGVESDVVLPSLLEYKDPGESALKNALKFSTVPAADFKPVGMVSDDVTRRLRAASKARIAKDSVFQKTQERIAQYLKIKDRKTISLNENVRREEMAKFKIADDDKQPEPRDETAPIFPKSHYNDEVLHIAVDYAGLAKALKTAGK
ncbi:MAG: carboxy terminal-processing peptidase [Planctomycetaceae bacterium]